MQTLNQVYATAVRHCRIKHDAGPEYVYTPHESCGTCYKILGRWLRALNSFK